MGRPSNKSSVFINCPFDPSYRPIFEAILFAVHDCGFKARCALENADSGQVRFEKILKLISECSLGIHDISRVELDQQSGLPRFNMPFELGLFLGARYFGDGRQAAKQCLILDSAPWRYQAFLSDISGHDIRVHGDDPDEAIRRVRQWLNHFRREPTLLPSGDQVIARFRQFLSELPAISGGAGSKPADRDYVDYMSIVATWLDVNPRP